MFVAANSVELPNTCVFPNAEAARIFQSHLHAKTLVVDGVTIKLQDAAANSLFAVVEEAAQAGIRVSPLDGAVAAGRNYAESVFLWDSRFWPAFSYWMERGKISEGEAEGLMATPQGKRIAKVIEWEGKGLRFGPGHSISIFSSTAPPGASQHLSLLAFDVARLPSARLIAIFNSRGWFQTVQNDPQHFTYLGLSEADLPNRGLRAVLSRGMKYWLPDITEIAPANQPY
jgi:hypothetical protein